MNKTYADCLKEADKIIDFNEIKKSWADKTLPNTDDDLDYEEIAQRAVKNMPEFMGLVNDSAAK